MNERVEKSRKLRDDLESSITLLKEEGADAEIKVSVYDVKTRVSAHVNGRNSGWAASVIKVPIMVAALQKIEEGKLGFDSRLEVDHKLILEEYDEISLLPHGSLVPVSKLLDTMMISSDNTATNMLAKRIGIPYINKMMWGLGMSKSMLGHLLCPGVKRYTSKFNPDGSNITSTRDMVALMRNIYDEDRSNLSEFVRSHSDEIFSRTHASYIHRSPFLGHKIKAKVGSISNPKDGSDIHETGIIDNTLIVSIMVNKIDPYRSPKNNAAASKEIPTAYSIKPSQPRTSVGLIYGELMKCIGEHFNYKNKYVAPPTRPLIASSPGNHSFLDDLIDDII